MVGNPEARYPGGGLSIWSPPPGRICMQLAEETSGGWNFRGNNGGYLGGMAQLGYSWRI